MNDTEWDTLYAYMLDAMIAETGHGGMFYLLKPDAPEWPRRHEVVGHPSFADVFEAEFRRRCDNNQTPDAVFVFLE